MRSFDYAQDDKVKPSLPKKYGKIS